MLSMGRSFAGLAGSTVSPWRIESAGYKECGALPRVQQDINGHISRVLGDAGGSSDKKEGLPKKIWQRIKSKIDSLGDKPTTEDETEERQGEAKR
jgi:hypothetical protein